MMIDDDEKVSVYEKSSRDKFKRLCDNLNLIFEDSQQMFDHYDEILYYKNKKYIVELKDRKLKYDYPTIMFEKYKYDNLIFKMKELNADGAYYISFFGDDAYIYKLPMPDQMDEQIKNIAANKIYGIFDKQNITPEEKRVKQVFLINKSKCKKYNINDKRKNN